MSSSSRAFTLIELLVVIAIIGVLSSIVLSSLNTARNKGSDAAIKSNLDQARTQAELFYDANNNKYVITSGTATDACSSSASVGGLKGIYPSFLGAAQASGVSGANINTTIGTAGTLGVTATCHTCSLNQAGTDCSTVPVKEGWTISVPLKSTPNIMYCVDSLGYTGTTTDPLGPGDTKCG